MRTTTRLTATGLLGLTLLAPTLLATAPVATAAAQTCQGRTATVVGQPGRTVVGTEGPDVIVTNGASGVRAMGGDDLVCVSGRRTVVVNIAAGEGNDVIDGRESRDPVFGILGTGADTFLGGRADDRVELTYPDPEGGVDDARGGAGADTVQLQTGAGAAAVDNAAGTFTSAGVELARWSDVEDFWIYSPPAPRDLTFVGSAGRDWVYHDSFEPSVLDVDLGGGGDAFHTRTAPLPGSRLAGGPGRDLVAVASQDSAVGLDLKVGRLDLQSPAPYGVETTDFEDAEVFAPVVLLAGTSGANRLGIDACNGTVTGRAGSDEISREYDGLFETDLDCASVLTFTGSQGNDRFLGSGGDDTILGGPGRDVVNGRGGDDLVRGNGGADTITGQDGRDTIYGGGGDDRLDGAKGRDTTNGGQGRDTCRAERERSCER